MQPQIDQSSGLHAQAHRLLQGLDPCGDLGSHAVAMHVPPWLEVAHELPAFGHAPAPPEALHVRAQIIERRAPIDVRSPSQLAQRGQGRAHRRRHGDASRLVGRADVRCVVAWQEAVAREGGDLRVRARSGDRERDVHGRQARAEQQDIARRRQFGARPGPGPGDIAPRGDDFGVGRIRRARRQIADRQYDRVGDEDLADAKADGPAIAAPLQAARVVMLQHQAMGVGARRRLAEQALQVLAVLVASHEHLGVRVGRPQPFEKMRRLFDEGAHIGRAHIQEMVRTARGIGGAPREPRPALDQANIGPVG